MAKPLSYLGVDLSPDAIKVVELRLVEAKPQLVTYGYTESKGDILMGDFINNKNLTSTMLKEVADKAKVTTNLALAALPTSLVFSSVISLPFLVKRDLDNRVKIKPLIAEELKKNLAKPLEEVSYDFNLMPDERIKQAGNNDKIDIARYLVTAAPNDVVKEYLDIFKQAGFNLTNLDIEPFALVRSLVGTDQSLFMIVDIGENRTALSIVNFGMPVFNRSIQFGGAVITKAIADSMKITISEAENYKLDLGIMMAQENMNSFPKPVEDALNPLLNEIKYLAKSYYDTMGTFKTLDKIILTGGSSILGNFLDKYLTRALDVRAYVGDPWARIVYPEELRPVLQEIGPRFSVALGLAMREIII